MILVDATHTSHSTARTGIQQLTRRLIVPAVAEVEFEPITHDAFWRTWRALDSEETETARSGAASGRSRRAQWSLRQKWRGRMAHLLGDEPQFPEDARAFVAPEIFSREVAGTYRKLFKRIDGPRVAILHDTIPLTHPELSPPKTVARFPAYLEELRQFDGVAAVSKHSRDSLAGFWKWAGGKAPPVVAIESGVEPPADPCGPPPSDGVPQVLSIGTIEGRKNHAALLEAAEMLWAAGVRFELHIVGFPRPETAAAAIARIGELTAAGRPLFFHGSIDDAALEARWHECKFSVYPSLIEGYGLPVIESVARGRPCICSAVGATGEAASGGGCLALESVDPESIARAIRQLLENDADYRSLRAAATTRPVRTWEDYRHDLTDWIDSLRRSAH
jgi:glycosyltransferase involved in cell wall biosynthesis